MDTRHRDRRRYGTREIIPRLPKFLGKHPLLRVEMTVADRMQDLVVEGADIAIRLGQLADSVFGARKLATLERHLVAAPSYLKARGHPKAPGDLVDHDCIFGPGGFGRESWSFARSGTVTSVEVHGRIQTDSGSGVFASLLAGLGIAIASTAMCAAEVKTGSLKRLLPDYTLEPVDVHAVFPAGPKLSAKVRAFVTFIVEELGSPISI